MKPCNSFALKFLALNLDLQTLLCLAGRLNMESCCCQGPRESSISTYFATPSLLISYWTFPKSCRKSLALIEDHNCRLQVFFSEEAHGANVSMDSSFQSVRNEALEQELEAWKLEARWVEEFTWKSDFKALRQEQSRKSAAEATGFKGLFESVEMDATLKTYKNRI